MSQVNRDLVIVRTESLLSLFMLHNNIMYTRDDKRGDNGRVCNFSGVDFLAKNCERIEEFKSHKKRVNVFDETVAELSNFAKRRHKLLESKRKVNTWLETFEALQKEQLIPLTADKVTESITTGEVVSKYETKGLKEVEERLDKFKPTDIMKKVQTRKSTRHSLKVIEQNKRNAFRDEAPHTKDSVQPNEPEAIGYSQPELLRGDEVDNVVNKHNPPGDAPHTEASGTMKHYQSDLLNDTGDALVPSRKNTSHTSKNVIKRRAIKKQKLIRFYGKSNKSIPASGFRIAENAGLPLKVEGRRQYAYVYTSLGSIKKDEKRLNLWGIICDSVSAVKRGNVKNPRYYLVTKLTDPSIWNRGFGNNFVPITLFFKEGIRTRETFKPYMILRMHRVDATVHKETTRLNCDEDIKASWVLFDPDGKDFTPSAHDKGTYNWTDEDGETLRSLRKFVKRLRQELSNGSKSSNTMMGDI